MEKDLAKYIAEELKILHPFYQWKVIKDTKKQLIEVKVTFNLEVDDSLQVQDVIGKNNESGYIQFEDSICFYDPAISHIQPKNYLKAISFNNQLGIDKGLVFSYLKQLNIVLSQGRTQLEEFVSDTTIGEFELKWRSNDLNQTIDTLKETNRYSEEKLVMNLKQTESIIDQFTKDGVYDGVERV